MAKKEEKFLILISILVLSWVIHILALDGLPLPDEPARSLQIPTAFWVNDAIVVGTASAATTYLGSITTI